MILPDQRFTCGVSARIRNNEFFQFEGMQIQRLQDVSTQGAARSQWLFHWQVLQRRRGTSCDRPVG